jgi:hypothetical protein
VFSQPNPIAHAPFQPIGIFRHQRALSNAGKIDNPLSPAKTPIKDR